MMTSCSCRASTAWNRSSPRTDRRSGELHRTELQSLAEATLEPSQSTERHYHRATEEIYLVTKGSGEVEVDGETKRVRPGDAILIPPGAWHTLENNGTSELVVLCTCSPPYSHDDTFFD